MNQERIQALIVDDEMLARVKIRGMLEMDPEVEIIGESSSGGDAVDVIKKHHPDLLFLDIQMPGTDGFAVLEALDEEELPVVILVTAYDHYALKAFEVHALDYLLKPFDIDRFERTVAHAKSQVRQKHSRELSQGIRELLTEMRSKTRYLDRVVVKAEGRVTFVRANDIDWVEAEGNYVRLHVGKETHLFRESITSIASKLNPQKFLRIHRSSIVNLDRIKELRSWFHGEYHVLLQDGTQLLLTRSYRANLKELLGRLP